MEAQFKRFLKRILNMRKDEGLNLYQGQVDK